MTDRYVITCPYMFLINGAIVIYCKCLYTYTSRNSTVMNYDVRPFSDCITRLETKYTWECILRLGQLFNVHDGRIA